MSGAVLAVDIGGTKIAAGLVRRDGTLCQLTSIPTLARQGAEALLRRVIDVCRSYLTETQDGGLPLAVAASSAGQIDAGSGSVIYATQTLPGWTGMQLKTRLQAALGLPVVVENDVNCLAVGESVYGAAKGCRHILCLALGTGIGGAMILDGKLYRGWKGSAGEVGHLSIHESGRRCYCGARGCLECYVSGPAIERDYARRTSRQKTAVEKAREHARRIPLENIARLAETGDETARAVIETAGYHLGYGLFGMVNLLNPQVVVIGGGVAALGEMLLGETRRVVASLALPSMRDTPVVAANFKGAQGSLAGAAALGWQLLGE